MAPRSPVKHSTTEPLYSPRRLLANSADPDEMLHYAAFHLGLHCQSTPFISIENEND